LAGSGDNPDLSPRPAARGPADRTAIGIVGGTFDPVHNGHLRIALDAREALDLAEVRLIPLAQAVHREQPVAPAALRLAMLEAAVGGRDELVVDDCEVRRGGPSFTIDTLRSLHERLPGGSLCLLLGSDAFAGFPGWRAPYEILRLANIALLQRPGQRIDCGGEAASMLAARRVERLDAARPGQIVTCPVTQLDIASSDIRARLASGRSADFLLPASVLALIQRHGLYR
jgi:nicotinate-nucleotide adenylyltransferase